MVGGKGVGYFCGFGDAFAEDFDFEVTVGGVELIAKGQRARILGMGGWRWAYCYGHSYISAPSPIE